MIKRERKETQAECLVLTPYPTVTQQQALLRTGITRRTHIRTHARTYEELANDHDKTRMLAQQGGENKGDNNGNNDNNDGGGETRQPGGEIPGMPPPMSRLSGGGGGDSASKNSAKSAPRRSSLDSNGRSASVASPTAAEDLFSGSPPISAEDGAGVWRRQAAAGESPASSTAALSLAEEAALFWEVGGVIYQNMADFILFVCYNTVGNFCLCVEACF